MKTYQDFMAASGSEEKIGSFIIAAIDEARSSKEYKDAMAGMAYYNKHNLTIEAFQKFLYTVSGRQINDVFSSNYKIKSLFFRRLVTQQVQYILSNGLMMSNKKKLGQDIDFKLQKTAKMALAQGVAYGFWNYDHLEVFSFADYGSEPGFVPLRDENTSEIKAGIRYWYRTIGRNTLLRASLYEEDGISEWKRTTASGKMELMEAKKAYITTTRSNELGVIDQCEENYASLPIAVLYGNDTHESELVGMRESIDCYDLIKSGLANDIDDTSGFYWILKNSGGMEDIDLAQFIQRMKTVRAAVIDGDEGATAEAHTLSIPVEARKTMLEILKKDIYADFQMMDTEQLIGGEKTATEIRAAYQNQDNKCADFEYYLIDFVQQICDKAGIGAVQPAFKWNKIVNMADETNMIISAANYLDDETILNHLPFLLPDEVKGILKRKDAEDMERLNSGEIEDNEEDNEQEQE